MTDYFRGANASEHLAPVPGWLDQSILGDPTSQVLHSVEAARELKQLAPELFETGFDDERGVKTLSALITGAMDFDMEARPEVKDLLENWRVGLERRKRAEGEVGILQGMVGWAANNPVEATAMTAASIFLTPTAGGATRLAAARAQFLRTGLTEGTIELILGTPRRANTEKIIEAETGEDWPLFQNTLIEVIAAGGIGGLLDGAIAFARRPAPAESFVNIAGEEDPVGRMECQAARGTGRNCFLRSCKRPWARAERISCRKRRRWQARCRKRIWRRLAPCAGRRTK